MYDKLAIHGGIPVRELPLPPAYPGASVIGDEEKKAVLEVLDNKSPFRYYGPNVLGKVKEFERLFSNKIGTKYTLGVTSGTAALVIALKASGIGPGDKVIVPACTFVATPGAVICAGAVPVFADIDESYSIDPAEIGRLADVFTKAVIPVPFHGNPCKMDKIMAEAMKYKLMVIEDVAQSCGSSYHGRFSGSFGNIGCFSLQLNKIITTGDGGAVTTDDEGLYERAVRYHDQGMFREKDRFFSSQEEDDVFVGQNYRMNEISGAIALEQLKKLAMITSSMHKTKYLIKGQLKGIDGISFRIINDEEGDAGSVLMMVLPDKNRAEKFRNALNAENIATFCPYGGHPVYMMPQILNQKTIDKNGFPFNQFDEKIVYSTDMCPKSLDLLPRSATINITPVYTEKDAEDVIKAVRKVAPYIL
jgi:8-amino-3,8-dideoxy-alpha-D-manno-octulosonate transaminase